MVSFISILLSVICTPLIFTSAGEFSASKHEDVMALYELEERLLPALNTFISEREEHLKQIEEALNRTSVLKTLYSDDIGEYLGNPLNQFHVVKRFVDDWGRLEEYLNSDSSTDQLLSEIAVEKSKVPAKDELNKALDELERNGIDPEGYWVVYETPNEGFEIERKRIN